MENLKSLTCPITLARFIEPVIGSDCHTYERSAIVEWLQKHQTSPMTCQLMSIDSLRSNLTIKNLIDEISEIKKIHQNSIPTDITPQIISDRPPPIPPRQSRNLTNRKNSLKQKTIWNNDDENNADSTSF
ncbi:unnamed protein product [Adineta steineri]|uniref:U-box domain-containing protein n=1 Tax=Adineta steineri TaxID=433720 RepID=A0A819DFV7_9BILA|nr:unnamed protein product [Adineta steineri]CAF3837658.1 unnamed protein product [Adineta steineri]